MNDKQASPVGGFVNVVHFDFHMAECHVDKFAGKFIMVARHKDDLGAVLGLFHDCRDNGVVTFRPVPGFFQSPASMISPTR